MPKRTSRTNNDRCKYLQLTELRKIILWQFYFETLNIGRHRFQRSFRSSSGYRCRIADVGLSLLLSVNENVTNAARWIGALVKTALSGLERCSMSSDRSLLLATAACNGWYITRQCVLETVLYNLVHLLQRSLKAAAEASCDPPNNVVTRAYFTLQPSLLQI